MIAYIVQSRGLWLVASPTPFSEEETLLSSFPSPLQAAHGYFNLETGTRGELPDATHHPRTQLRD